MSFIRAKEIPPGSGNWYAYEVKTTRENGKVRQKVVGYIGRTEKPEPKPKRIASPPQLLIPGRSKVDPYCEAHCSIPIHIRETGLALVRVGHSLGSAKDRLSLQYQRSFPKSTIRSWVKRYDPVLFSTLSARMHSKRVRSNRTTEAPDVRMGTWPYLTIMESDSKSAEVMLAIARAVPMSLPSSVRDDICQDVMVAVLSGELATENLEDSIRPFIKQALRMIPGKYGTLSLDRLLTPDGLTLKDVLGGRADETVGICSRCEEVSYELDGGLCEKCFIILETEVDNQAKLLRQADIAIRRAQRCGRRPHRDSTFERSFELSEEDFYNSREDVPVLRLPAQMFGEHQIEGHQNDWHDSNRRTNTWKADPMPYIENGLRSKRAGTEQSLRRLWNEMKRRR